MVNIDNILKKSFETSNDNDINHNINPYNIVMEFIMKFKKSIEIRDNFIKKDIKEEINTSHATIYSLYTKSTTFFISIINGKFHIYHMNNMKIFNILAFGEIEVNKFRLIVYSDDYNISYINNMWIIENIKNRKSEEFTEELLEKLINTE